MTTNTAKIIPFNIESHQLRVMADDNGEPWFVATDACAVLGYKNAPDAIAKHCRQAGIAKRDISSGGQMREVTVINEGNLYRLIIKCRLPVAERLEALVCDEILPTIRKTGQYTHPDYRPESTRETHPGGLTLEQQDAVKALHKTLVEAAPHDQRGALAVKLWSSVKKKFGVSYKDVPPADFAAVLSLMSRVAIDGEYLPKQELPNALHELPKAGTSPLEFIFSSEVAEARERVYQWLAKCRSAMLAAGAGEPGWPEIDATDFAHAAILETVRNAKFCVGFGEKGALQVSVIPSNAAIATAEQLPDLIRMGSQVPDKVLPKIIQAVASRM